MRYFDYLRDVQVANSNIEKRYNDIEIEVYTNKIEPVGIVTDIFYLRWHRKYFTAGEFELECALNDNNFELLKKDNLITRIDAVEFGIVEDIKYTFDEKVGEKIVVKGKFGTRILDWRVFWGSINYEGTSEDAIRKLVRDTLINSSQEVRIDNFELQIRNGFSERTTFQATDRNVLDQCNKICRTSNLGMRVTIDYVRKRFLFDVYKGRDLSSKVVLSDEDNNIKNSNYSEINSTYRGYFKVKGEGEGKDRVEVVINDDQKGWYRREMYIDARDLQKGSIPDEQYKLALRNRGEEKKVDYVQRRTFEATTEFNYNSVYKEDWNLGDIITVRKENWGLEIQERVTEVEEIYTEGEVSINPVFGSPLPEIKDILKGDV